MQVPAVIHPGGLPGTHYGPPPVLVPPPSGRAVSVPRSHRPPTMIEAEEPEFHHPGERIPTHHTGGTYHPVTSEYGSEGRRPLSPRTQVSEQIRQARPGEPVIPHITHAPDEGIRPVPPSRLPSHRSAPRTYRSPSIESIPQVHPVHPVHSPALMYDDSERQRQEVFEGLEHQLRRLAHDTEEAEDMREKVFRDAEDDRRRIFEEREARRDQESSERRDQIWRDLEDRLAGVIAPPPPPPPEHFGDVSPEAASIHESVHPAASQRASEILDSIKDEMAREREESRFEREKLLAEFEAVRDRGFEDRDARIRALEEELASVREELENERQQKVTEEADIRQREREAAIERDDALTSQLNDITNLVQEQRSLCDEKKRLMDERWEEKVERRHNKEEKYENLTDLIGGLRHDMEMNRLRAEDAEAECKARTERMIDDLRRQNDELRELLTQFTDGWRDIARQQHEETIHSVRETAAEQVPFNVQGYLDEFSKALASEVRMLLGEVGKLREERRSLQHELGFLLCMKSKYVPGGEFDAGWKPPTGAPGGPPPDAPPEPPMPPGEPQQVKPGWRTVHQRTRRKKKESVPTGPPPAGPPPGPPPPMLAPGFPPQHDLRQQVTSWATWQPDPGAAPTPPSVEPTLIVPGQTSPGLFGPRSPRSSFRQ